MLLSITNNTCNSPRQTVTQETRTTGWMATSSHRLKTKMRNSAHHRVWRSSPGGVGILIFQGLLGQRARSLDAGRQGRSRMRGEHKSALW